MAETIKSDNYLLIQGWMITQLGLKGNELLVYACIYGFSQDGEHNYKGGIRYLMGWTNSSKVTVINILKTLTEKGLIIKEELVVNGVKVCDYFVNQDKILTSGKETLPGGKETVPQYINNNINNKYIDNIKDIINYLNYLLGTKFLPGSKANQKHIIARLNEGFTVDDFKQVIDTMYEEWHNDNKMRKYLRPETLFGTKFESYLNRGNSKPKPDNDFGFVNKPIINWDVDTEGLM